jgi:hypothetical protein
LHFNRSNPLLFFLTPFLIKIKASLTPGNCDVFSSK